MSEEVTAVKTAPSGGVSEVKELVVRIAGDSQDGIQVVGDFLARYTGRSRMGVITFQTFPATIAGGPSIFQFRIGSNGEVRSAGDEVDMLVAFYQHSYQDNLQSLREGGILLYDTANVTPDLNDKKYNYVGVPITELTVEAIGGTARQKGKNMFAMGLIARMFDLNVDLLNKQIQEKFMSKGESVYRTAADAFQVGYGYNIGSLTETFHLYDSPKKDGKPQVTMNGNQALAYGLIAAGVRFGAGYPITPWSSIMEILRAELPKFGGTFVQAEDEISAIGQAIGSSFAGKLAVTGTSGPGLSLKVESLGYAVIAEIPLILICVQRGGPSTGLPTKVEQSDLNLAIFGGHGDSPRVVVAPKNVEDAFYVAIDAVKVAREYNVPVIILSDQAIATRIESWEEPDLENLMLDLAPNLTPIDDAVPYKLTESGVSERPIPGTFIKSSRYPVVSGLEHDEQGHPLGDPENHVKMNAKRRRKLQSLADTLPVPKVYGEQEGDVCFVTWGSSVGPTQEAIDKLRAAGSYAVGGISLRFLNPLPNDLDKIFDRFTHVFVVELNDEGLYGLGQLASILRARYAMDKIKSITKTDGLPFKVREIIHDMTAKIRN